jgi:hypothetical protein
MEKIVKIREEALVKAMNDFLYLRLLNRCDGGDITVFSQWWKSNKEAYIFGYEEVSFNIDDKVKIIREDVNKNKTGIIFEITFYKLSNHILLIYITLDEDGTSWVYSEGDLVKL